MLKSRFDDLRRKKELEEKRDLPLRVIAADTKLALSTIQRVKTGPLGGLRLSTLETLCQYFSADSISDLIEYAPE